MQQLIQKTEAKQKTLSLILAISKIQALSIKKQRTNICYRA